MAELSRHFVTGSPPNVHTILSRLILFNQYFKLGMRLTGLGKRHLMKVIFSLAIFLSVSQVFPFKREELLKFSKACSSCNYNVHVRPECPGVLPYQCGRHRYVPKDRVGFFRFLILK